MFAKSCFELVSAADSSQDQIGPIASFKISLPSENPFKTFVDFRKAFDNAHRGKMRSILIAYGIPSPFIEAIVAFYEYGGMVVMSLW